MQVKKNGNRKVLLLIIDTEKISLIMKKFLMQQFLENIKPIKTGTRNRKLGKTNNHERNSKRY